MLAVGIIIGGGAFLGGLPYYVVPFAERPFSPLHELFAPTGLVGQGLGVVGTAMIALGVTSYAIRKRVRALARFGKLKHWLRFHIFLCLLGPFLVLLHTTFKFGGFVAISFWSMVLVVASGVFGRWVYVWIPKATNGRFLGREEIREHVRAILGELEDQLGMTSEQILQLLRPPVAPSASTRVEPSGYADRRAQPREGPDRRRRPRRKMGVLGAVGGSMRYAVGRRKESARFHRILAEASVSEPARSRIVRNLQEESRIEQQLRMLDPFQAAFRYWHAFHLPLATVMLLVLIVHVGVAVAFGYTWIWAE